MLAKKLKRLIKAEYIDLMQTNVADAIKNSSKKYPVFEMPEFVEASVEAWREELRMAAYIFGDSYYGMSCIDNHELLSDEEFEVKYVENLKNGDKILTYFHRYLSIRLLSLINKNGKMCSMNLEFEICVNMDTISDHSLCGMGMVGMKIENGIMSGQMEVTGGLSAKLTVLKSFATADQLERTTD